MKYQRYHYTAEDELLYYEFVSEGSRGRIKKVIEFSKTNVEHVYNLAFGDFNEETGQIDDKPVTNNGDA